MPVFLNFSKSAIETFTYQFPWACISIVSPGDEPPELSCPKMQAALYLQFDDVDNDNQGFQTITDQQCLQIKNFAIMYRDLPLIAIHCQAGMSRSSAVAAALHSWSTFSNDKMYFNKCTYPNMSVYNKLRSHLEEI